MKNKYGFCYTPLTKVQKRIFEKQIADLEDRICQLSADHEANRISYSEYNALTYVLVAEQDGIRKALGMLGWKYDQHAKCLVIRDMGYERSISEFLRRERENAA